MSSVSFGIKECINRQGQSSLGSARKSGKKRGGGALGKRERGGTRISVLELQYEEVGERLRFSVWHPWKKRNVQRESNLAKEEKKTVGWWGGGG